MPNTTSQAVAALMQGATVAKIKKVGYLVLWEKPKRRKRRVAKASTSKSEA